MTASWWRAARPARLHRVRRRRARVSRPPRATSGAGVSAVALCLGGIVLASAAPADAQTAPRQRQYQGLFGGTNPVDPNSRQGLDLTASLNGTYQDNIVRTAGGALDPILANGLIWSGAAGLNYWRQAQRFAFTANGGIAAHYTQRQVRRTQPSYHANVGFSTSLGPRTTFSASQGFQFIPYYLFGPLRSLGTEAFTFLTPTSAVLSAEAYGYQTNFGLGHRLSTRSSLAASYSLHVVDFRDAGAPRGDFKAQQAGLRFTRAMTENASVYLGYSYREGAIRASSGNPIRVHNIDAGVNYARALSLTRRTTLGFGTGSAIIASQRDTGTTTRDVTAYRLIGNVTLTHDIGRSWIAHATYSRQLRFIELFESAFFNDAVSAGLNGHLNRRTSFAASANYATGKVGLASQATPNGMRNYGASAQIQVGLTRNLALSTQYFYQHHRFGAGVTLPTGFVRNLDRQGVRVGLSFWLPLLR